MKKSGLADSPFFAPTEPENEVHTPPSANPPVQKVEPEKIKKAKVNKKKEKSNRDTMTPRYHDTTVAWCRIRLDIGIFFIVPLLDRVLLKVLKAVF